MSCHESGLTMVEDLSCEITCYSVVLIQVGSLRYECNKWLECSKSLLTPNISHQRVFSHLYRYKTAFGQLSMILRLLI